MSKPRRHGASCFSQAVGATLLSLFGALVPSTSACAQDVVVGQVLSLTGPTSAIGRDLLDGRQACTAWVNAHGGIRGRLLRLVTRDDAGDAGKAVALAEDLLDRDRVALLLGPMGPAINAALLPWASRNRIVVLGPHAGDVGSRNKASDTAFFLTQNHSVEVERLAMHLATLGVRQVAMVYSADELGRSAQIAFEEALSTHGLVSEAMISVNADGSFASSALKPLVSGHQQAIVLATSGQATVATLQALEAQRAGRGFFGVYGLSFAATPRDLTLLGSQARGLVMTQVLPSVSDTTKPLVKTYAAAMAAGRSRDLSTLGLEGCLGPLVLAEVFQREAVEPTRANVLKAFNRAGKVTFGEIEIPLGDRESPGARFSDIVIVGPDGKMGH